MTPRRFTMRLVEQVGDKVYHLEIEVSEESVYTALNKGYVLEREYMRLAEQFDHQTRAARDAAKTALPRTLKETMKGI